MNADLLIVLLLLGAAILMFAVNRPRVDAVALLAMAALPFTGVITVNEAIAGFANPNIVRRSRIAPRQLMMPMAYAALISGMMTLVATSPNLVINYELIRQEADGFNFLAFTPFGVPILLVSILYMHFARRWLGTDASDEDLQLTLIVMVISVLMVPWVFPL